MEIITIAIIGPIQQPTFAISSLNASVSKVTEIATSSPTLATVASSTDYRWQALPSILVTQLFSVFAI